MFSKLDANSGFWKIELTKEAALLTTFITSYGRYCFNHLPFGITSAPEHFQRHMSDILRGLEGVEGIDDILVYGKTHEEHDKHLTVVLQKVAAAGITLNPAKCEFSCKEIRFLGQLVDTQGIRADPSKVKTLQQMKEPKNISELHRFLGMINQLGKFTPNLAENTKPLHDLLSTKNRWTWGSRKQEAFKQLQSRVSSN